jgi:hypothetical protein
MNHIKLLGTHISFETIIIIIFFLLVCRQWDLIIKMCVDRFFYGVDAVIVMGKFRGVFFLYSLGGDAHTLSKREKLEHDWVFLLSNTFHTAWKLQAQTKREFLSFSCSHVFFFCCFYLFSADNSDLFKSKVPHLHKRNPLE